MAYFIILGISNVFQSFNVNLSKKYRNILLLVLFLILFAFAALRGSGNGDYYTYLTNASYINSFSDVLNNNFPMEIGFRFLSYMTNLLNLSYQWPLILMNFISLTVIFLIIARRSTNPILSGLTFMPFFFMFDMQAARTAPAIAISMIGIKFLIEGKMFKYFLTIIIASLFHAVALVMLPVYFIRKYNTFSTLNIVFTILLIPFSYILNFLEVVIRLLTAVGLGQLGNRLLNYTGDMTYGYSYSLLDPRFLLLVIIFLGTYYLIKNESRSKHVELYYLLIWLSIISIIFFRSNTFVVNRISSFFSIYMILLVPELLSLIRKKYGNNVYLIVYIIIMIVYSIYSIIIFVSYPKYILFF